MTSTIDSLQDLKDIAAVKLMDTSDYFRPFVVGIGHDGRYVHEEWEGDDETWTAVLIAIQERLSEEDIALRQIAVIRDRMDITDSGVQEYLILSTYVMANRSDAIDSEHFKIAYTRTQGGDQVVFTSKPAEQIDDPGDLDADSIRAML